MDFKFILLVEEPQRNCLQLFSKSFGLEVKVSRGQKIITFLFLKSIISSKQFFNLCIYTRVLFWGKNHLQINSNGCLEPLSEPAV